MVQWAVAHNIAPAQVMGDDGDDASGLFWLELCNVLLLNWVLSDVVFGGGAAGDGSSGASMAQLARAMLFPTGGDGGDGTWGRSSGSMPRGGLCRVGAAAAAAAWHPGVWIMGAVNTAAYLLHLHRLHLAATMAAPLSEDNANGANTDAAAAAVLDGWDYGTVISSMPVKVWGGVALVAVCAGLLVWRRGRQAGGAGSGSGSSTWTAAQGVLAVMLRIGVLAAAAVTLAWLGAAHAPTLKSDIGRAAVVAAGFTFLVRKQHAGGASYPMSNPIQS